MDRHRRMTSTEEPALDADEILRRLRPEMSAWSRLGYLYLLLVGLGGGGMIGLLWATEPGPLPLRLHLAFGGMILAGLTWAAFAGWVISARRPLFARERVIAGWIALVFSLAATLSGVVVGLGRGTEATLATTAGVGSVLVAAASWLLLRARRWRRQLLERVQELAISEGSTRGTGGVK